MYKVIIITEGDSFCQPILLQDFISDNYDGLTFEEINSLNRLNIDDEMLVSTHCSFATVTRIK